MVQKCHFWKFQRLNFEILVNSGLESCSNLLKSKFRTSKIAKNQCTSETEKLVSAEYRIFGHFHRIFGRTFGRIPASNFSKLSPELVLIFDHFIQGSIQSKMYSFQLHTNYQSTKNYLQNGFSFVIICFANESQKSKHVKMAKN